jgi:prephenate dehydrogenase
VVNGSFDIVTKPLRIAINGYGRIGRCFLRALLESPCREHLAGRRHQRAGGNWRAWPT